MRVQAKSKRTFIPSVHTISGLTLIKASSAREVLPSEAPSNVVRWTSQTLQSVLNRLDIIESRLDLDTAPSSVVEQEPIIPYMDSGDPALSELWDAATLLRQNTHQPVKSKIWLPANIQQLWQL
jgi:hypothetical protein